MSVEIPVAFIDKWRDDFIHLSQQKGSRFRSKVRTQTGIVGKSDNWERLGKRSASQITSRHAKTPLNSQAHSRRRCTLGDYNDADVIDSQDQARVLGKLENEYLMAMVNGMGRKMDDVVIAAMLGNATSVDENGTESSVALPAAQKVAAAAGGLTLAKILEAKKILDASDVDDSIPRCMAVTSYQLQDLLGINQITSGDFNINKTMVNGSIGHFLGFDFFRTERLTLDSNGDRQVIAWAMDGVGLSVAAEHDIVTRISERADLNYSTQCYVEASFGACRVEDEKVVEIACVES